MCIVDDDEGQSRVGSSLLLKKKERRGEEEERCVSSRAKVLARRSAELSPVSVCGLH